MSYTYDAIENITSVSSETRAALNAAYTYDAQGQLTGETNYAGTFTYEYDSYGNIRSVTKEGQTAVLYGYDDEEWLDKLTSYAGQDI